MNKELKKYCHILIPIITTYLILISYYPKLFKFFGNMYCQLLMIIIIIYLHFKYPPLSWLLGVLFLLTYKFYNETSFIREAFAQKSSLPPEKTPEDVAVDIKKLLTKHEASVIQNIKNKYKDSIDYLLEDDLDKLRNYECASYEEGVGLPTPVKTYDLEKTIVFDLVDSQL